MERKSTHILLIDDDPNLLVTMSDILKVKGFKPVAVRTGTEALAQIEQKDIDVALIDLRLEDMPGLEVLRAIKQRSADTECILLTGHASQDAAIEAINLGAYSFFQKPFDIEQVLIALMRAAEKRATGKALNESQARYHTFINATADMAFLKDEQFRYVIVNEANARFFGRSVEEIIGRVDFDLMDEKAAQTCRQSDMRTLQERDNVRSVEEVNGRFYETRKFPVPLQDGRVGVGGYIRDVTERQQVEEMIKESEEHYRGLFDDSPISIWEEDFSAVKQRLERMRKRGVKDFHAYLKSHPNIVAECAALVQIVNVNKATLELYRARNKEELLKNLTIIFCDDSYENFQEELLQIAEGRTNFNWEGVNQTLDGQRLYIQLNWTAAPGHENDLSRVILSIVDITERRQAEDALHASEKRVQRLLDQQIAINQLALALGENLILEDIYQTVYQHIQAFMDTWCFIISSYDDETKTIRAEFAMAGEVLDVREFPLIPLGKPGEGTQSQVIHSGQLLYTPDHQEAVRESKRRYTVEDDGAIHEEYPSEKDQEDTTRSAVYLPMKVKGKTVGIMQVQSRRLDAYSKEDIDLLAGMANVAAVAIQNARLHEDVMRELIERKQAEENVRASEERYRMLAENMSDTVWLMDMNLKIIYISPSVTKLRGYTLAELNAVPLDQQMTPESLGRAMQLLAEVLRPENLARPDQPASYKAELEFLRKDGTKFWSENTFVLIRDTEGNPTSILGSGHDITDRKQAQEEIQQQIKELEVLYESGMALNRLLEPKEIGQKMIEILARKLDWHHAALRLYHPETERVEVLAISHPGLDGEAIETERLRLQEVAAGLGKGLSGWVIKHSRPVRSGNLAMDKRYLATYPKIRSGVYVPIQAGEITIGSIAVESEIVEAFSEQDERLLATLASQAAIAFENARLYQEARQDAKQRAILHRAGQEIAAAGLDLEFVFASIHRATAELMPHEVFFISLYDPEVKELEFIYTIDSGERYPVTRLPVGKGISGRVVQKRASICIRDYQKEKQIKTVPFGKGEASSILAVPMFSGSGITGVISVQSYRAGQYKQEDQALLEILAAYAGAAIENARLYAAEQRQRQLSEALRDALGAGASLSVYLDFDTIMDRLLEALERFIPYDQAAFLLVDRNNGSARIAKIHREEGSQSEQIGQIKEISFDIQTTENLRWMEEHRQPLAIPDVLAYPGWIILEGLQDTRSWAGAPIVINDEVIGFFSIDKWEVNFYSREHTEMLQAFTGQAMLALQNASLFEQTNRRAELLAALHEVSVKLSHLFDLKSIGEVTIPAIESLLGWRRGSLWLVESDGSLHMLTHSTPGLKGKAREKEIQRLRALILKPGDGIIGWVIQNEQAIRCGNVQQEARYVEGGAGILSELCVPLTSGGKTIGCLNFESEKENAFSEEDEQVLSTLAGEIAGAVERARLFEQTRRRAEELGALAQVSSALRTANTRLEMIPVILDQLAIILKIDDAALLSYDPASGENVVESARGKWAKAIGRRVASGEGLSSVLVQTRQPFLSANILDDKRFAASSLFREPEAAAGMPLLVQKQFLGSLWVGRCKGKGGTVPTPFNDEEMRLLGSIADMTANALHRARLHEQAVRHADQMLIVNEIGYLLSETLDLEEIYTRLTGALHNLLPEVCAIFISLYHERSQTITCASAHVDGIFMDVKEIPAMPFDPEGKGRQSHVLVTGKPLIAHNLVAALGTDPRAILIGDPRRKPDSALYVPMFSKGTPIGLIQVQSYQSNYFGQEDVNLLALVANTAAVTIENARLFSETQKRLHNLSALHNIDAAISASVDLHVTLSIILENVARELNMDAAAILLMNPYSKILEFTASRGFRVRIIEGMRIRLGEGLAGQAAIQRRLVGLTDASQGNLDLFGEEKFSAQYAIPLIAKGQVHGVLQVFHRSAFIPDLEWTNFFNTLAGQAAIAIDNARLFEDLERSNLELTLAYDATILGWSQAMELRDKETQGHTERVTELSLRLGREMELSDAETVHLRRGVLLHDIGKMGIPDAILLKPGPLSADEWNIMRQHPLFAYNMLSSIAYLHPALDVPYCHHEKWDGSGYPRGLKMEGIPLLARLFAVVDVYDAISSDRPYRKAWSHEQALEYLGAQSGKHFDPQIVEVFLKLVK